MRARVSVGLVKTNQMQTNKFGTGDTVAMCTLHTAGASVQTLRLQPEGCSVSIDGKALLS